MHNNTTNQQKTREEDNKPTGADREKTNEAREHRDNRQGARPQDGMKDIDNEHGKNGG